MSFCVCWPSLREMSHRSISKLSLLCLASLTRFSLTRLLARPPARQVYSNGAVPAILATAAAAFSACKDLALLPMSTDPRYSLLTAAFLGYIACCAGDTWVFVSLARLPALPMHAH